jgi:putative hemolysin
MTFIKQGFRVSVVSDVRERVRDLGSPLHLMLRRSSLVECVSVLQTVLELDFRAVKFFVLPSTGFELTPLIHCSAIRVALHQAP